jgi:hypothetical protein
VGFLLLQRYLNLEFAKQYRKKLVTSTSKSRAKYRLGLEASEFEITSGDFYKVRKPTRWFMRQVRR